VSLAVPFGCLGQLLDASIELAKAALDQQDVESATGYFEGG